jgi:hypothetical protein
MFGNNKANEIHVRPRDSKDSRNLSLELSSKEVRGEFLPWKKIGPNDTRNFST